MRHFVTIGSDLSPQSVFACSFAIAVGANAYTYNATINFEKIWTTAHTFDSEINAVAGNKLYVTNPNGSLAVLNKTTGNLLETINLGGAPNSVAAYGSTIAVAVVVLLVATRPAPLALAQNGSASSELQDRSSPGTAGPR